jgi:hypothetical protein
LPGGPIVSDAAGPCCQPGADCCQPGAACPCGPALSHPVCGLPPGSPEIKLANDCPLCADGCPPEHDPVNPRVFARAEYLLWFMNKDRAPVLATTGTVDSNAILGANGTVPLFGGGPIGQSMRSGGRFTLGGWIDDCRTCGVDGNFFFLARRGFDTSFNSAQLPTGVLARPAFAPNTSPALMLPGQTVEQTAFPGRSTGVLDINGSSALWGAEVNPRHRLLCGCNYYLDVFAGFRYLDLNENLGVTEFINVLSDQPALSLVPPTVPAGTQIVVFDRFETHNRFYGGQVGLEGEYSAGRFFVNFRPKVALGVTEQRLDIDGGQLFNFPPGNTTMPHFLPGGFLTTPTTNMGSFTRSKFSVVPEVTLTAGYQITDCLRVFGGYNLLYWSNVLRPGQQIDSVVDVALVPNPFPGVAPSGLSRPAPLVKESNLWLQGVNVGVEWRW